MTRQSRRDSLTSLEELDDYFADYVPLSNLPTPPPPIGQAVVGCPAKLATTDNALGTSYYTSPAVHLVVLIPSNACTHRPSVAAIHAILTRCQPTDEILGLAGCILDALSMRFSRSWRQALGTAVPQPEVIVLAALFVAASFLEDQPMSLSWWCRSGSDEEFSKAAVRATTGCLLVDIDYDLLSFTPEMVADMIGEMKRPLRSQRLLHAFGPLDEDVKGPRRLSLALEGVAGTWEHGLPTPSPSP